MHKLKARIGVFGEVHQFQEEGYIEGGEPLNAIEYFVVRKILTINDGMIEVVHTDGRKVVYKPSEYQITITDNGRTDEEGCQNCLGTNFKGGTCQECGTKWTVNV